MARRITSVDVGFSSLGLVSAIVQGVNVAVDLAEKVDLRVIPCGTGCALQHSGNVVDRVAHLVAYYRFYFDQADRLLIERQPVTGITDVQALLYKEFRDKTTLVSPNALHKHFGLPRGAYELRKQLVVQLTTPFLSHLSSFTELQRQHDVSDALCMVLYVVEQERLYEERQRLEQERASRILRDRAAGCFDRFRCGP